MLQEWIDALDSCDYEELVPEQRAGNKRMGDEFSPVGVLYDLIDPDLWDEDNEWHGQADLVINASVAQDLEYLFYWEDWDFLACTDWIKDHLEVESGVIVFR